MAEIKISEMDELIPYDHYILEGGTDGADYIPLLDSSEVDPNLQNKKVSIQTLFDDYTRQYNTVYPAVTKQTLTNNFFDLYNAQQYSFLNPDESFIIPPSALTVNSSAPSVTSADVGLLGLNNNIPQYVNSGGSWTNLASSNSTVYQQIRLSRITSTQSIIANTFPATLFNQVTTTNTGTSIGSFNTTTGILTLDTVGTYMFVGTLTLNGGVSGTRAIFYAEATLTGQVDTQTRVESVAICNSAGSFIIPINFVIKVLIAPTTFKLTTASSTNVSIANADSTLSSFAESQVTIVKIN